MNSSVGHRSRLRPATNRRGNEQDEASVRLAPRRARGWRTTCRVLAMLTAAAASRAGATRYRRLREPRRRRDRFAVTFPG